MQNQKESEELYVQYKAEEILNTILVGSINHYWLH